MDNEVVFQFSELEHAQAAAQEVADAGISLEVDEASRAITVPASLYERVEVTLLRHGAHAVHPDDEAGEDAPPQ